MDNSKSPFASTTLWGAVIVLLAFISMQFFGVEVSTEEQAEGSHKMVTLVESVAAVVGWVMVILGRFKAETKLKF